MKWIHVKVGLGTKQRLVLIDIRMPHMDGIELYSELKKIDPAIKVCFLTADDMYYEYAREKDYSDFREDVFIQKPISTNDLVMKINEKIDHLNNESKWDISDAIKSQSLLYSRIDGKIFARIINGRRIAGVGGVM